jgi:HAE1 family hydrophobic/amphiphilic exporter-1
MRVLQKFCVSRPVTTAMFYLGLVLMGVLALRELEVNLLPELELPRLTVVTLFNNAAPEEVESLITRPLSESVGTVSRLKRITSESLEGVSFLTLQFNWGTRVDFAVMEVREKLDLVRGLLPEDATRSLVTRFDPGDDPFMQVVFFAKDLARPKDLRHFLENEIKVYLDRVDGVAQVEFAGGYKKEVQVDIDQTALSAYGLSFPQIENSIAASNVNAPAGSIQVGDKDVLIRTLGEYADVRDIGRTVIGKNQAGVPVQLARVAEIRNGYEERTGLSRYNGRECVVVSLRKESGKNTVQVAEDSRAAILALEERFARELDMEIVYDESRFVRASIQNIALALAIGSLLAFSILILILRNLRSPTILITVLPISVLTTCLLMYTRGISLNMMSLGGMALGIGMLFDSGNVVLSAIERQTRQGLAGAEAALKGAGEVTGSITAAVLTTVTVFLPIVFLESVVGIVFAEMALTITFSLLVSLMVSLTLIPMLSSLRWPDWFYTDLSRYRIVRRAAVFEERLESAYEGRLRSALARPRRLFLTLILLLVGAVALIPFVEREFIPEVDTGEFSLEVENVRGASLASTAEIVGELESRLLEHPDIEHVIASIGFDRDQILGQQGGRAGRHFAELRVVLADDRGESAREVAADLREKIQLRDDIGVQFHLSGDVLTEIFTPDAKAISLELTGGDLEVLRDLGGDLRDRLAKIPGIVDIETSLQSQGREFHAKFDDARMARANLSRRYLANYLRTAIDGSVATRLRVGDEEIDIRVRLRPEDRASLRTIETLRVASERGDEFLPLSQLMRVESESGYTSILRFGPVRVNRVTADLQDANRNQVFDELAGVVESLKLPEGYRVAFSGEYESVQESFRELGFAFLLATVLIYMILAAQFESLRIPGIMLLAIPLIVIGVIPALLLTGNSLNVSAFTGLILLIGIVVDAAALFYEYVHVFIEEGRSLEDAIVEAGKVVLRPILMNNSTTLLGLLPVALKLGEGTEFQAPMAVAVISGLIASVFLSLFLIPVVFARVLAGKHPATSAVLAEPVDLDQPFESPERG